MIALTRLQLIGLLIVMMACFVTPLSVAFNIGVMATEFGASLSLAGFVATIDGLVAAFSALVTSRYLSKFTTRQFFLTGMLILCLAHMTSAFSPTVYWLMALQAIAGIGVGMVLSVVLSTAGRTLKPEMTMGIINASLGGFLIALGIILPIVIGAGGLQSAYLTYSAVSAVGILAAFLAPNVKAPDPQSIETDAALPVAAQPKPKTLSPTIIALLGVGLFFFAQAGFGAFVERMSAQTGLTLEEFGRVVAVGGFLTIIGPLIAGKIGARFGATLPLVVLVSALCVATFGIAILTSPTSFYVSTPLFTVLPGLLTPSFTGALARLDLSGRVMGMYPAFTTLGGSLGPYFSGTVLQIWGFEGVGWYTMALFAIAACLMGAATLASDRASKAASAP